MIFLWILCLVLWVISCALPAPQGRLGYGQNAWNAASDNIWNVRGTPAWDEYGTGVNRADSGYGSYGRFPSGESSFPTSYPYGLSLYYPKTVNIGGKRRWNSNAGRGSQAQVYTPQGYRGGYNYPTNYYQH